MTDDFCMGKIRNFKAIPEIIFIYIPTKVSNERCIIGSFWDVNHLPE